jgi:hypothetical protein
VLANEHRKLTCFGPFSLFLLFAGFWFQSEVTTRQNQSDDISGEPQVLGTPVSVQEMVGQDYCTERGEAKENKAQDSVDETEEDRANAVGMKRTTTISAVNQVIRPALAIRIPHPGAL